MSDDEPQPEQSVPPPAKPGPVRRVISRVRRPDRVHMAVLSQRVPYWFVAAFLFAFSVVQIELNPFGFSDLTQRYTQDIADLLITGPYFYGTEGRDKVSVALVDEDTLHSTQQPWPWDFGTHARVLDAILLDRPRAVVVDFLFVDPRPDPTLPQILQTIADYRKAGVPLYFEGGILLPYGEVPIRSEIARTGVPVLDPSIPVYNGVSRQYYVKAKCMSGVRPQPGGGCLSAAVQVFHDVYGGKYPLEPLNGDLELTWGTKSDPINAKWMTRTDENGARASCLDTTPPLKRIYLAFFDTSSVQNLCPYTGEIPVQSLLSGDVDDPDVVKLVRDRVVFYGGSLEGAQDKSYSPVNGLIPSVFVHAMAMDNLITYHGRPQQNVMTVAGTVLSNNPAQIAAIIPVILVLTWLHMQRLRRRRRMAAREGHARSATFEYFLDKTIEKVWHWLAFGLALGVGLLLTLASGLSVANWVEVVFVSVELAAMLLVGLPDSVWGYLHHVAAGQEPPEPPAGEQAA
ncbi:MAG TPA: CHASE2 domain-containing protein [Rhizomicrobium sp.]|nr:CHASE2 domain-containing protein [Rhizomicrobium sp.]